LTTEKIVAIIIEPLGVFFYGMMPIGGRITAGYAEYIRRKIMRERITLACTECKQRNYDTMKNKKNDPDRLQMNKYCPFCRKHTPHKETK